MLRRFRRTTQDPDTTPPLSVEAEAAAELRRVAEALGGSPPGTGVPADSLVTPALDPAGKAVSDAPSEATVRRVRKVPPPKGASAGRVDRAASRRGSA